jgi:hypothetical protein
MAPDTTEGRLIALRKALALALSQLPQGAVTELLEQETLRTGDEDPSALPDAVTAEAGAMATELAALRDEVARLRANRGR